MTEGVRLAEPKLVALSADEQAEAVRLLPALLRASIAERQARAASRLAEPDSAGDQPMPARARGRRAGARTSKPGRVAGGLPLPRSASGKRGARNSPGGTP